VWTRAFIRSAMKRWVSAGIMRSSSATGNQLGRSRQSGRSTGTQMQAVKSANFGGTACPGGRLAAGFPGRVPEGSATIRSGQIY
jgi:hypothetical protein